MATKRKTAPLNTIVQEGYKSFPENYEDISRLLSVARIDPPSAADLLAGHHPKYHGPEKPGCILVKKRLEKTYQEHYLDIYGCLTCGLEHECLRSGWELGWFGGTESRKLK